jgi:hypothetical protein
MNVFTNNDVNISFSNFLNIYPRFFYTSFPIKKAAQTRHPKAWITPAIWKSCTIKRTLYMIGRNSSDPIIKKNYKNYCKILSEVIMIEKKRYYNNLLIHS